MIGCFGSKIFTVSRRRIYTFSNFSLSSKLQTEKQDATGKKPTSNIKGPGLNTIKITLHLNRIVGVNPRTEWEDWETIKDAGEPFSFILGGRAVGLNKYLITDCSLSKTIIDGRGDINAAELALTFEEYLPPGKQIKAGVGAGAGTSAKAAGLTGKNVYNVVVPSAQEKAQMKRKNNGM